MLAMTAWTGMMAQDTNDAEYVAAKEAITDGGTYRIKTTVSGTDYYVTAAGNLTSAKADAELFTITKTSGGHFGTGFRISSETDRFTNPPLANNVANLTPGSFAHSTGDRGDWERQILYLNGDGKYAIRSCNVADATSSWGDAGRTHWNVYLVGDVVTPRYNYEKSYIWDFDGPLATVNVTYVLIDTDGTTQVKAITVKQEANSAVDIRNVTCWTNYGYKFEDFRYEYDAIGTIGTTDCVINVTRTLKPGTVGALADLSNEKAYEIGCERGAFLVADGKMIAQCLDAAAAESPRGKFAVIKFEDKYFLYSTEENMFVKKDGSLANNIYTEGFSAEDAVVLSDQGGGFFMMAFNVADHTINVNSNQPLGYVINNYATPDPGNKFFRVAEDSFDPTNALATLQEFFHPTHFVKYVIKDGDKVLYTSEPQPTPVGAQYTTLPDEFRRPFYTYADFDVTVEDVETTTIEVAATWAGPFEISTDFASAHWYDLAMRTKWYVTTDKKDGDGAYLTQMANTMGLVEDSYHWAFIGDGYNGFKVINKAEGEGKSFGWTDEAQTDAGIPSVMDDAVGYHIWKIVASTNTTVPANSFCLNVPGTDLYINQYGGANETTGVGGSLKFWNSTGNIGDAGSAFTVFDIPTNFAEYLVSDGIADVFTSTATGYFTLSEEAKAQFDPAYETDCTFETYKALKELLSNPTSYILPETGFYTLKNKYYGTYMGIDPSDANLYGNYATAVAAKQIVKLTKVGSNTYNITLMGKNAPATVAQSQPVTGSDEAGTYTVFIPTLGYGSFMADPESPYSALHRSGAGDIVGWTNDADASLWVVEDAESIQFTVTDAGYATAYMPFPFTCSGVASVPEAIGTWTFEDGTTGTLTATSGVTVADGVATVPAGDNLSVAHGITDRGTYSFMMDVKIVNENSGGFTSLFMSGNDREDGGLFFNYNKNNGTRTIGINLGNMKYGGSYELDTWYRVVFSCDNYLPTVYVNGEKVVAATQVINPTRLHWTLSDVIYFFADNDGEENDVQASEIRLWDVALTADEVAMLQGVGYTPEPASDLAAYTGKINGEYLTLTKIDGTVPALTPVVIKATPETYTLTITEDAAPIEDNDLKGTLSDIADATGKYVLTQPEGEDIGFWKATSGTLKAGKAYLEIASEVNRFLFFDEATGIANVEKATENGPIYNIAGQRLSKVQKGINIVNGKKVLY